MIDTAVVTDAAAGDLSAVTRDQLLEQREKVARVAVLAAAEANRATERARCASLLVEVIDERLREIAA